MNRSISGRHHGAHRFTPWIAVAVFAARICGQALAAAGESAWLPPMTDWYSGLIPWTLLLPLQLLILVAMSILATLHALGESTGAPRFSSRFRKAVLSFAAVYLAAMMIRFVLHANAMAGSGEFWLRGTIAIFTHWVLAGFLLAIASSRSPEPCAIRSVPMPPALVITPPERANLE